jgi:hypothetical protein
VVFRWADPRTVSVVPCPASSPEKVVGHAHFSRVGNNEGARLQIASRKTAWLSVLAWHYTIKFKVVNYIWPDRSVDPEAEKQFEAWNRIDKRNALGSFPGEEESRALAEYRSRS